MKNKSLFCLSLTVLIILLIGCSKTEEVAQEQIKKTSEEIEEKTTSMLSCVNIDIEINNACFQGNLVNYEIDNRNSEVIPGHILKVIGDKGFQEIDDNTIISAFNIDTISKPYDSSIVGSPTKIIVTPGECSTRSKEEELIPC